jgi:hypothetical protein
MSDATGLFPSLGQPLADVIARRQERAEMADLVSPSPALEQPLAEATVQGHAAALRNNRSRAVWGAWLLAAGVYGTYDFMVRDSLGISGLMTMLTHYSQGTPPALGAPVIWCAMALLGGLGVAVGVGKARSPLEAMGVFWVFCLIGGSTYALVDGAYFDDAPIASWYLRGLYLATFAASVMELYLFTRCADDDVAQLVERPARLRQTGRRHQF